MNSPDVGMYEFVHARIPRISLLCKPNVHGTGIALACILVFVFGRV